MRPFTIVATAGATLLVAGLPARAQGQFHWQGSGAGGGSSNCTP